MIKMNLPWVTTKQELMQHMEQFLTRLQNESNRPSQERFYTFYFFYEHLIPDVIQTITSLKAEVLQSQEQQPLCIYKNKYKDVLHEVFQTKSYEFNFSKLFRFSVSGENLFHGVLLPALWLLSARHIFFHIFLPIPVIAALFQMSTLVSLPLTFLSYSMAYGIRTSIFYNFRDLSSVEIFLLVLVATHNAYLMGQFIFSMSALTTSFGYAFPFSLGVVLLGILYECYNEIQAYFEFKKSISRAKEFINSILQQIESPYTEYIVAAKALEEISLKLNFSNDILTPALAFFAPHSAISNHAKSQKNICYQKLSEYIDRLTDHGLKSKLSDLLNEYLERGDTQLFTLAIQEIEKTYSLKTLGIFNSEHKDSSVLNSIKTFLVERNPTCSSHRI